MENYVVMDPIYTEGKCSWCDHQIEKVVFVVDRRNLTVHKEYACKKHQEMFFPEK